MNILVAVGTRPEAIKLAPLVIRLRAEGANVSICSTGQHPELTRQALAGFGLAPDIECQVSSVVPSLASMAASLIAEFEKVVVAAQPSWVVVQGDTLSAFTCGLTAFLRRVPVAHVEAGMRTGTAFNPFPEEANRAMLARIASVHFAATEGAAKNLLAEGVEPSRITVTGNTVVDALRIVRDRLTPGKSLGLLSRQGLEPARPFVIVTCHRRENWGPSLVGICDALRTLAARFTNYDWLLLLHPNPALRHVFAERLGGISNVLLRDPLDYEDMLLALGACTLVLSDSGGLVEESVSFGKPIVVLRDRTERPEAVIAGYAELAGQDPDRIVAVTHAWLDNVERRTALRQLTNPFGDGHAAERIAARLLACGPGQ